MEIEKIEEYLKIMQDNDLSELEVTSGDSKIKLKKNQAMMVGEPVSYAPAAVAPKADDTASTQLVTSENTIDSPMVGTFYNSPTPDDPAFVTIGSEVKEGQVICIIEAMKMFNQIEADRSGIIKKVLVEDSTPVEYGQPLFVIE